MIAALLVAGAAALAEPAPARRVAERGRTLVSHRIPVTAACAAAGVVVLGRVTLAVAGAMAGATAIHMLRARRAASAERRRRAAAAAYLGAVSTNLQAGATLLDALARAGEQVGEAQVRADAMRIAHQARTGARLEPRVPELERLGVLWTLSVSRGVPLAKLIAALRDDIDHANRHRDATRAALAGPQTTAAVLAALPAAGVLMGTAMGASPIAFLTGGGLGGVLLVAGTALVCAGVLVSGRIIQGAGA
ncbi:type II secretion system F family protein [Corynebacterium ureicelerivorans]|uniref:type II secretion system F family protein n=1 Tax=Corynebacterium ureicelerivorans TaxID=401472 RepID=UPI002650E983|nr:type II secretion system F family protein [Corynebacterium ureicelerivorans]MDN8605422.1 type II secretion system F family protein [Corynebacterium ureicelerivorans]